MKEFKECYAFVADDDGLVAAITPGFGITPFVTLGDSPAAMEHFRTEATLIAQQTGKVIRLLRFTKSEVIEVFASEGRGMMQ